MTDKVSLLLCLCQVALSVAAEFWEQGDLERTVLEQQPIVCSKPILFFVFLTCQVSVYVFMCILVVSFSSAYDGQEQSS